MTRQQTGSSALRRWIAIGAAVWTLGVSGRMAQAQTVVPIDPSAFPLSPRDPHAQLNPALRDLPPIEAPLFVGSLSALTADHTREVCFTVETGEESVGLLSAEERQGRGGKEFDVAVTPGYGGPDVHAQFVFGTDDRQLIGADSVASFPYSAQCKLFITCPDGQAFIGSGTLVSAKHVLTAGHCVYNAAHGGWAKSIEVVPGLAGTYQPFGSAWAKNYHSHTGWTNGGNHGDDFALITLDREIGNATGWLGYGWYPEVNGVTARLIAYPGDRDQGLWQYFSYGPIEASDALEVYYHLDMMPGESGGGVYQIIDGQRFIFGVNAYQNNQFNFATRITSDKYQSILDWINSES